MNAIVTVNHIIFDYREYITNRLECNIKPALKSNLIDNYITENLLEYLKTEKIIQ